MDESKLERMTDVLKAVAHPTRLQILEELRDAPRCVGAIEDMLPVSQVNISQHLSVLRHAHLVNFVQEGALRCYYLSQPELVDALFEAFEGEHKILRRSKNDVRKEREEKNICPHQ